MRVAADAPYLRLATLLLAAAVAACTGGGGSVPPMPAAPAVAVAPHVADDRFIADDGAALPLRVWKPAGETTAVVLAVHGFNDYSNAFAMPAADWAEHGIATYAYDQRGFGAAPDRGYWAGSARLATDLVEASRVLRSRYPHVPLYLLGESMGGAVVIVAETGAAGTPRPTADGIILTAPAVWGRDSMTVLERVALWIGYHVIPGVTVTGRGLGIKPSDNVEMLRAIGRDPLVIKETRIDTIYGLVDLMDAALDYAPLLDVPLLVMYGARDEIVPSAPIRRFVSALPPEPRRRQRLAWYENGYHMLLRDLQGPVVIADVASWVLVPAAPLPSGADRDGAQAFLRSGNQVSLGTR